MKGDRNKTLILFVSFLICLILVLITAVVIFETAKISSVKSDNTTSPTPLATLYKPEINLVTAEPSPSLAPISQVFPLDKSFTLGVKDQTGKTVGTVNYLIKEYEFTNQVVVNHQFDALLKKNKELLVLHVEITNDTNYTFKVMAGDQVRLTLGDDEKLIAPDISTDPEEVRPKSTIETSIGFILDKDGKSLVIHLGEPGGETQSIPIPPLSI